MTDPVQPNRRRIHVIYEYGPDFRPYSSSFLRLIRPLSHPLVSAHIDTTFGLDYNNEPADLVIIDRLWRFDITLPLAEELVNRIRLRGSRFVYCLDDDYFDLAFYEHTRPISEILPVVTFLLRQADAVVVTTPALRQRLLEFNPNIQVLPNPEIDKEEPHEHLVEIFSQIADLEEEIPKLDKESLQPDLQDADQLKNMLQRFAKCQKEIHQINSDLRLTPELFERLQKMQVIAEQIEQRLNP